MSKNITKLPPALTLDWNEASFEESEENEVRSNGVDTTSGLKNGY